MKFGMDLVPHKNTEISYVYKYSSLTENVNHVKIRKVVKL